MAETAQAQTPAPPEEGQPAPSGRPAGRAGELREWRTEIGVATGLLVLVVLWTTWAPNFLTTTNLTLLAQQTSVMMIIAVGMTCVILTGEIDLSVGSMVGLSGVLLAELTVRRHLPLGVAILVVFAVAVAVGLFTGILRVRWGIPSFIVTLGLLSALQGVAFTISNGVSISPLPSAMSWLWNGRLAGVPFPVLLMVAVVLLAAWVLSHTRYGRHLYAVGGNAESARRYGLPVGRLRISVFVLVQCLAALGGLMFASQLSAGNATVGQRIELNVIAAVVIGGASLFGGAARITGSVLGVLFIAVLGNGLVLLGVTAYVNLIAQGIVVIAAVWWSVVQRRERLLAA
jgi:ribose transport system permease protein